MEKRVSFIHCADIHLDAPFSVLGKENLSAERRKDLKRTFEKIIELVLEKNADFLLVAGDLYEHRYVTRSTITWVNEQFKKLGRKPVIIIPGNHDPYVRNSWYRSYRWNDNVHILTSENPDYFDENLNVYFYGIGFDAFHQETLPVQKPPEVLPDRINICLFHGTLKMQFTEDPYNPAELDYLTGLGFDYYAVGHFHTKDEGLFGKGIINPGSPEPLGFDEKGEHGVYLVELTKGDTLKRQCTFIRTQQRAYYELDIDIGDVESTDMLTEKISNTLCRYDSRKNILRINLTGRLNQDFHVDVGFLERRFETDCFSVWFTDNTKPGYDLEALSKEKTLAGVFVKKMKERIDNADEKEKPVLEKALYFGLEALFEGSLNISE